MKNKETGQERPITRETLKKRREKMSSAQERREKKRLEIFEKMSMVSPPIEKHERTETAHAWRDRFMAAHGNVVLDRQGYESIPEAVRKQSQEAGLIKSEDPLKEAEKLVNITQKGPTNWMIDKFLAYITRKIMDFGFYHHAKGHTFLSASYVVKPWSYAENKMIVTISIKEENAVEETEEVTPIGQEEVEKLRPYMNGMQPIKIPKKRGRPRIVRPGEFIPIHEKDMEKLYGGQYDLMTDGTVVLKKTPKKTPKKRKVVAPDNHKKHVEGLKGILKSSEKERKVNADKSNKLSGKKKIKKKIKVQKKKSVTNKER